MVCAVATEAYTEGIVLPLVLMVCFWLATLKSEHSLDLMVTDFKQVRVHQVEERFYSVFSHVAVVGEASLK